MASSDIKVEPEVTVIKVDEMEKTAEQKEGGDVKEIIEAVVDESDESDTGKMMDFIKTTTSHQSASFDKLESVLLNNGITMDVSDVHYHPENDHAFAYYDHPQTVSTKHVPVVLDHTPHSRWNNSCTYFALVPCMLVMLFLVLSLFKRLPKKVGGTCSAGLWIMFFAFLITGFVGQPEVEDPSISITFGAGFQVFAMTLYWLLPRKTQQVAASKGNGDSAPFALLLAVAITLRLFGTLRFQGYLPTDESGDGCYQLFEATTLVIALRGLARTGLTTRDGMYAGAAVTVSVLLGLVCYGDLNQRVFADRAFAAGLYVEVCAWAFLATTIIKSGTDRTISSAFLAPALAQACCRTYFWYLAAGEMAPMQPKLLMNMFPDMIVAAHFAMCGIIGMATLLTCCPEQDALVAPMQSAAEPIRSVVDDAAGAFEMAKGGLEEMSKGLVPVRAVWENGVMKVEYAKADGPKDS